MSATKRTTWLGPNGASCQLTFTVTVSSDATSVTFGGAGTPTSTTVTPTCAATCTASTTYTLPQGLGQVLSATATGPGGTSAPATVSVNVDTISPIITQVIQPTANEIFDGGTINFDVQTSGAETGQIVTVTSTATEARLRAVPLIRMERLYSQLQSPSGGQVLSFIISDQAGNASTPATVSIDVIAVGSLIQSPRGTINLAADIGGDRSTFAGASTLVSFTGAIPPGTQLQMCTTLPLAGLRRRATRPASSLSQVASWERWGHPKPMALLTMRRAHRR